MQANTASGDFRTISTAIFPKKTAESDPYSVVDGHYIGNDGFIIPKDFAEFDSRFPGYVRKWVRRHSGMARPEDVDDWTQDLTIHLMALPAHSKFREQGKNDLVQTFNPERH